MRRFLDWLCGRRSEVTISKVLPTVGETVYTAYMVKKRGHWTKVEYQAVVKKLWIDGVMQ